MFSLMFMFEIVFRYITVIQRALFILRMFVQDQVVSQNIFYGENHGCIRDLDSLSKMTMISSYMNLLALLHLPSKLFMVPQEMVIYVAQIT